MSVSALSDEELLRIANGGAAQASDEELARIANPGGLVSDAANQDFSATRMLGNVPASGLNFAKGIYDVVRHPLDTASNLSDLFTGAVQNSLPAVGLEGLQAGSAGEQRQKASAVGDFFKNRYGSKQGFLSALENDPVGVLSDASVLLTGGAAAASKIPKLGELAQTAAKFSNPIVLGEKAAQVVGPLASKTADVIGAATHTGGDSIRAAYEAGKAGGSKAAAFRDAITGNAPIDAIVGQAKAALAQMRQERGAAYRSGMVDVSRDKTVLDFSPIDAAFNRVKQVGTYKGKAIRESAVDAQDKIGAKLAEWRSADPAEFHTPEGLDALKQSVGDIRDSLQPNTPAARVADSVYQAIKQQIVKQAPGYAGVMADYERGSQAISEAEKALSLGKKASTDTALRKLQSVLRSNVNTNFGKRLDIVKTLENSGAPNLTASIAGQSLSNIAPRGLGAVAALPNAGTLAFLAHNPLAAIPGLAVQSPRLMGELAYGAGTARRGAGLVGDYLGGYLPAIQDPEVAGLLLSEAGQRGR